MVTGSHVAMNGRERWGAVGGIGCEDVGLVPNDLLGEVTENVDGMGVSQRAGGNEAG